MSNQWISDLVGTLKSAFRINKLSLDASGLTAIRTALFPDKDITVAGISDLSQILYVRDEKSTGTQGGASSAGNNTRVLNTQVTNTISGASLASNQITLPAGTYQVHFSAPCLGGQNNRAKLYNVTDSSNALIGESAFSNAANVNSASSTGKGIITISGTKVFELRHYILTATATFGLGGAAGDGLTEIYASVFVQKIG
jgi:hypothetical protein